MPRTDERPKNELPVLVAASAAFSALDVTLFLAQEPTTGWAGPYAGLALQLVVDLSLVFLARFPRAVFGLGAVAAALMLVSDQFAPGLLVPLDPATLATVPTLTPVLCWSAVRSLDRREWIPLVTLFAVLAARPWTPAWDVTPFGLLNTATPAVLAMYFQARAELLQSLRERAERAEREQHLLAEQARGQERRRLAAEMHDVVTHQISLMVLHAGALGVSSTEPSVRSAAAEIRSAGTRALDELRDLVGVLRTTPSEVDPSWPLPEARAGGRPDGSSLTAIRELAAESEAVGIPVTLTVDGDPDQVSPTISRTAYRVVQESLTNVRKHAPGSTVDLTLSCAPDGVRISVRNGSPGAAPDPLLAEAGSGAGLAGLRQRVELLGGVLRAGPSSEGGFELSAILPAYVPTADTAEGAHDPGTTGR